MRKLLFFLFVSIAFVASARVYTFYYGPNHSGKYLEMIIHGDEAIVWKHDSIPTYSHARVEEFLGDSHLWRVKFVRCNKEDNTLMFKNTVHNPVRINFVFPDDFSTLEIKDLRKDADLPSEKLPLVDLHIDPRAGTHDFIGDPKLSVRVLDPRDKTVSSDD